MNASSELPQFRTCNLVATNTTGAIGDFNWDVATTGVPLADVEESFGRAWAGTPLPAVSVFQPSPPTPMSDQSKRRIVQIYIADPNEYVPLEKALLYKSPEPFLTDLTDQELFYELELKDMLAKHNEVRVQQVDKKASAGKDTATKLEPARMRDLTMTVLTLVSF